MASDRGLAKAVDKELATGSGLTRAVSDAVEGYSERLRSLGGYLAERVTDLQDVRDRLICELRGLPAPGLPDMVVPGILVAHDLAPADTAALSSQTVLGILTEAGGPTSHTAILAAQLGIPAVVQVDGLADVRAGTVVGMDGSLGEVLLSPGAAEVTVLADRSRSRAAALAGPGGAGATRDGHRVALLANIGTAADAVHAATRDVEGSGLFRTEFLFLDRATAPTLLEQTDAYTAVLRAFGDRRVVVRTLDAGADKPLPFADLGPEQNPALGRRGLRLSQVREDLLRTQLEALAAAYRATGADVGVMAPMVSTVEEAEWFAARVRAAGLPVVGVMIETPAAALQAERVLSVVDFASIGTNDLAQYTMAADRLQGGLAGLLSPWQPAVLQLVRAACEGGRATAKHIGVCGEAAGDPLLSLVLTGAGATSLSMATSRVAVVRAALRLHDMDTCVRMAAAAVSARTATDGRAAVLAMADPAVVDLL
jgi:phosphotransferase system enzyme I (PtsI)